MKTLRNPYLWITFFSLLLLAAAFGQHDKGANWASQPIGHVQAQAASATTNAAPAAVAPANATEQVSGGAAELIVQLAQQYPWLITLLAVIGSLRIVIKPLMTFAHLVASQTPTKKDDDVLDKIERSWLYTAFLFALDWLTSIKVKPQTAKRIGENLGVAFIAALTCTLMACNTPSPTGQIGATVEDNQVTGVNAGVSWSPSTNVNVSVGGELNPNTGEWSGNLLITFKDVPPELTQTLAAQAGAALRKGTVSSYVLQYDSANRTHRTFIRDAQLNGALISALK